VFGNGWAGELLGLNADSNGGQNLLVKDQSELLLNLDSKNSYEEILLMKPPITFKLN
jgi:hypothetical protein